MKKYFAPLLRILNLGLLVWMAFALECDYELHVDAHWFQGNVECQQKWNTSALTLKGNPLYNFGIQTPFIANLSPAFIISKYIESDKKVVFQIIVEAFLIYFLLRALFRNAGVDSIFSEVLSLISSIMIWIPSVSGNALTAQITLGLYWQEIAIHNLAAFYLIKRIDTSSKKNESIFWCGLLGLLVFYSVSVFPAFSPYFFLCNLFGVAFSILVCEPAAKKRISFVYLSLAAFFIIIKAPSFMYYLVSYTREGIFDYSSGMRAAWLQDLPRQLPYLSMFTRPGLGNLVSTSMGLICLAACGYHLAKKEKHKTEYAYLLGAWLTGFAYTIKWLLIGGTFATCYYFELVSAQIMVFIAAISIYALTEKLLKKNKHRIIMYIPILVISLVYVFTSKIIWQTSKREHFSKWPPSGSDWTANIQKISGINEQGKFQGKCLVLLNTQNQDRSSFGAFYDICANKIRKTIGSDLLIDLMHKNVPLLNEYGQFISPPFLSLLCLSFYDSKDPIARAARCPRVFNAKMARLLGVSSVVIDSPISEELIMHDKMGDHDLFLYKISQSNMGTYTPTKTQIYCSLEDIYKKIKNSEVDFSRNVFIEDNIPQTLVPADVQAVSFEKGPVLKIKAKSNGWSLIVLPFDFSYCLKFSGSGEVKLMPVNLSCTGVLIHGDVDGYIDYKYSMNKSIKNRKKDYDRSLRLGIREFAPDRLFYFSGQP